MSVHSGLQGDLFVLLKGVRRNGHDGDTGLYPVFQIPDLPCRLVSITLDFSPPVDPEGQVS